METKQVSKSEFKAKALELFREVEASGDSLVITSNGKPVLQVKPYRQGERAPLDVLRGSVLSFDDPTTPVDVEWDAQ